MVRFGVGLALFFVVSSTASAQLSGGSFGGSGDFGGGSSSSWGGGGGGSSSHDDWAARERDRAEERRRAEEDRRRAEEDRRRRAEEERRRAEEAERRRIAEERRRAEEARQLAADRSLPVRERVALRSRFVEASESIPVPAVPEPSREASTSSLPAPLTPVVLPTAEAELQMSLTWALVCGLIGFAGTFGAIGVAGRMSARLREGAKARRAARAAVAARRSSGRGSCELRRISIAFDPRERAAIQALLVDLARRLDLRTPEGRHRAADEVVRQLVSRLAAARYAAWSSRYAWPSGAKGVLQQILADLKSRYRHDVTRGDRVDVRARAEEGDGLVVVSLVLGSTRWLAPLPTHLGHTSLAQALHDLVRLPTRDVVALEVIWSPALEQDRMSSLELEAIYPELLRLDEGALGRASCGFCGAVHAAELGRCPACGAPAAGVGAAGVGAVYHS